MGRGENNKRISFELRGEKEREEREKNGGLWLVRVYIWRGEVWRSLFEIVFSMQLNTKL